jgi:hypothetical protein
MSVQAIHRQLDRCDLCGKKIHRKDLVYTNVRYNRPQGNNYFTYSRYNSSLWSIASLVATGNYDGFGPNDHGNRVKVGHGAAYGSYETTTEHGGAPTFALSGITNISHSSRLYTSSAIDCSTWDSLVFGLYVGPYHDNRSGSSYDSDVFTSDMAVAIGVGESSGSLTQTLRTVYDVRSGRHVWAKLDMEDLDSAITSSSVYFCVSVKMDPIPTSTFKIWFDWMQLEKDATVPGAYIETSGSALDYTTEKKLMTVIKVCPDHREQLLSEREQFGRPRQEVELPIDSDIQEV